MCALPVPTRTHARTHARVRTHTDCAGVFPLAASARETGEGEEEGDEEGAGVGGGSEARPRPGFRVALDSLALHEFNCEFRGEGFWSVPLSFARLPPASFSLFLLLLFSSSLSTHGQMVSSA